MYKVFVVIMAENTVKDMTTNFRKLDKFEGHEFRRGQKKMHFLLTTLKVVYVLTTPITILVKDATVKTIRIRKKWKNDDYICRRHILNGMLDSLFDEYTNVESAKELWDSHESKYMAEDSSSNKFFVEDGFVLYMGDDHFAPVHGKGSIMLEFSSGKSITLFNVLAVVRLPDQKKKTLGEKGIDCIFFGYAEHSKAYRFYVIEPNDSVSINSIIKSSDAIFDENCFSSILRPNDIIPNLDESQRDDHSDDVSSEKEAIDDEIDSIMKNNTWVLSDLPPGCKPLGCNWIFKRKIKVDGTIDKFKARLVI
nr:zinc finger, CCHC-type [Tanacetum cinerariifolium]